MTNAGIKLLNERAKTWDSFQVCLFCQWERIRFVEYDVPASDGPDPISEYQYLNCDERFYQPDLRNNLAEALELARSAKDPEKMQVEGRHLQAALDAAEELAEQLALLEAEVLRCADPVRLRQMLSDSIAQYRRDRGLDPVGELVGRVA